MPDLCILIVNWNSRQDLLDCLASVEGQRRADDEVIVVDNGSEDGSREAVAERYPAVHVIATGENLGFAEGCNRGLAEANAAWIFTLNNDSTLAEGALEVLRSAAAQAAADVGMLQSCIVFRDRPDRINSAGVLVYADGLAEDRGFGESVDLHTEPEEIFFPTAGAALYRRAMLDQLETSAGVFDRNYFMYYEDADLGWRARLAGWRAFYVPDARVVHAFQGSAVRHGSDFVLAQCRINRIRTLLKNASWRCVLSGALRSIDNAGWLVRRQGLSGLRKLATAVKQGLAARSGISRLASVGRRELEQRWLVARR